MSILSVENHINVALISLTVAPSTCLALAVLLFAYLYIIHARNNPIRHRGRVASNQQQNGHNRGAGRPLRRPPFIKRLSARLRTRKQRDRPAVTPLWVPLTSFWLPLRQRFGNGGFDVRKQIQPAGMASRPRRQPQQRLLE